MASRIRIDRSNAELVKALVDEKGNTGPFQTYADVLAFAAAFGVKSQKRIPIETTAKEPAPINLEVFISRGYDWLFKLLAIAETQDPNILSLYKPESEAERLCIFEEYANGGLSKLREELRGSVDYSERILLIMTQERYKTEKRTGEFDLSRFL